LLSNFFFDKFVIKLRGFANGNFTGRVFHVVYHLCEFKVAFFFYVELLMEQFLTVCEVCVVNIGIDLYPD